MARESKGPMAQHIVTCKVQLGGDPGSIVVRGESRPVPYPEIPILRHLHGDTNVFDVEVCGLVPRSAGSVEKNRMATIYGREAVEHVYPGGSPNIDWYLEGEEPEFPPEIANAKASSSLPITPLPEKTGAKRKREPADENEAV
jgi:hypothetical protein